MAIELKSTAFDEGGMIPKLYTCDGRDVSPPLHWPGVPEGSKSLALIADDPDAPMGTWVHWVLFNLPADTTDLPEGVPADEELPDGARQGTSDFGRPGYGGPCPPSGSHRYFFKVYALDALLDLPASTTKEQLVHAMEGHVLARGELMGTYSR